MIWIITEWDSIFLHRILAGSQAHRNGSVLVCTMFYRMLNAIIFVRILCMGTGVVIAIYMVHRTVHVWKAIIELHSYQTQLVWNRNVC